MTTPITTYVALLLPAIWLSIVALAAVLVEAFQPESFIGYPTRKVTAALAIWGFIGAAAVAAREWNIRIADDSGMLVFDHFTAFLTLVFSIGGILAVFLSIRYLDRDSTGCGEYYSLLLFAAVGAYLMAAAHHLVMVFLGLEVLSLAIYPLAGFFRRDTRSNEASLKYFLLGAFSSAFFFYGMALVYGAVGLRMGQVGVSTAGPGFVAHPGWDALNFDVIRAYILQSAPYSPIFWAGIALVLVGFCFKAALAPFHMWTPDVYDGAPTPITAFMSSVVKAAAFAPFFRFFLETMGQVSGDSTVNEAAYGQWVIILAGIAVLTMTWGNVTAVAEPSIKRMLAFSSIAHAGYITVALIAESRPALLYYLLVYTLMVIGSFGCAGIVRLRDGEEVRSLHDWTGLGLRYPWLGAAMSVFMFSLAGFPPTAGFMGKFVIFRAALETGGTHQNGYILLVVAALINSLISIYYYLKVVVVMYRPAAQEVEGINLRTDDYTNAALLTCAVGVILLGIFPQAVMGVLQNASF